MKCLPTLFWFDISISYPSMLNLCAVNQHPDYHCARQASQFPRTALSASGRRCTWSLAVVNTQSGGELVLYETYFGTGRKASNVRRYLVSLFNSLKSSHRTFVPNRILGLRLYERVMLSSNFKLPQNSTLPPPHGGPLCARKPFFSNHVTGLGVLNGLASCHAKPSW
jgi:hypothetical protein